MAAATVLAFWCLIRLFSESLILFRSPVRSVLSLFVGLMLTDFIIKLYRAHLFTPENFLFYSFASGQQSVGARLLPEARLKEPLISD